MTFVGVAEALWIIGPVVGDKPADEWDLTSRVNGATVTFESPQSFGFGFYGSRDELWEADSSIEATLVVEHVGGAGRLRVHWGWDSSWDYPNLSMTPNLLGEFDVSGSGLLTIPLSGPFDLTRFREADDTVAFVIEVVSGAVEINHLRLRVWPAGGPVGWWSPHPGWTVDRRQSISDVTKTPSGALNSAPGGFIAATAPEAYAVAVADHIEHAGSFSISDIWPGTQSRTISRQFRYQVGIASASTQRGSWSESAYPGAVVLNPDSVAAGVIRTAVLYGGDPAPVGATAPPDVVLDYEEPLVQLSSSASFANLRLVGLFTGAGGASVGLDLHAVPPGTPFSVWASTALAGGVPLPAPGSGYMPPATVATEVDTSIHPAVSGLQVAVIALAPAATPTYTGAEWYGGFSIYDEILNVSFTHGRSTDGLHYTLVIPSLLYWDATASAPPEGPVVDDSDVTEGYLISPNPNLDGLGLGVAVDFVR